MMSFRLDGAGYHRVIPQANHGGTMIGHLRGPLEPKGSIRHWGRTSKLNPPSPDTGTLPSHPPQS